jgi:hypothetical protein
VGGSLLSGACSVCGTYLGSTPDSRSAAPDDASIFAVGGFGVSVFAEFAFGASLIPSPPANAHVGHKPTHKSPIASGIIVVLRPSERISISFRLTAKLAEEL